jgi:murein L,D-transpeptidase YcbB/YkuD
MSALRAVVLIFALAGLVAPAAARISDLPVGFAFPSPQQKAVSDVLDATPASEDPVDAVVLEGVTKAYEARHYSLLWLGGHNITMQMTELRGAMDRAADFGLDPASYQTPALTKALTGDRVQLAAADVEFSRAVARFVTHIASGRIRPIDISKLITLEPERPDVGAALSRLSESTNVAADLASYEPPHPDYQALKIALAKLRALPSEPAQIDIPEGKSLKPGQMDARVPLLRARLRIRITPGTAPKLYDDALVTAVKLVQADAGLPDDGILGPRTIAVLKGRSREDEISSIAANLERWRWMPRDLGAFHVIVNVPEFMVRVVENGSVVHETRVVVGKPTNRTPTFSNAISYLIVNPYWNVPTSIVSKEMLPEIQADPYGYFARQGYQVFTRIGGRMRQIDPSYVNWYGINPRSIQIRQIPGDANALGRIKFMFPNQHSVYLHDTPSKRLFQRDVRALSHGCVRVENPLDFADALLRRAAPAWNSTRLQKLYGGPERRVDLDTPVPVHLTYFTAFAEPDGTVRHFDDVYGYDGAMSAFFGS